MIRPGTKEDIPRIIEMGRAMFEESAYKGLPYEPEKIGAVLERCLDSGCVLVADGGFMLGMVSELWFCSVKIATDLGLYVEPEKRRASIASELLEGFIAWAESQRVAEIYLGISTGVNIEATERLYARFGFSKVGGLYKRRA